MADSPLIPVSRLFRFACDEEVSKMEERPGGHHCASCSKTVVDMSVLTLEEAITKMRSAPPSTCVSYAYTEDGRLLFRSARRALGPVVLSVAAFLAACQPAAPEVDLDHDPKHPAPFEPAAPPSSPAPPSAPPAPDTRFVPSPDVRVVPPPDTRFVPSPHEIAPTPPLREAATRTAGAPVPVPPPTWRGEAAPIRSSDPGWPSATQTTVEPPRPPVIQPVPPRPIPPRLAGKPVFHAAGGMGDATQLEL